MKFAIIGVGALGSYFGGMLAKAGQDVTLVVRNEAHRAAIQAGGLTLKNDAGSHLVHPVTCAPGAVTNPVDIVFVFTKTGATRAALAAVPALIGPETRLVSLQNGLGNQHVLAEFVPLDRVIYGTTTTPADLVAPAEVASHGPHLSQFNDTGANSVTTHMATDLAALLSAADMPANHNPDVDRVIWAKVAFNTAMNSICALLGAPAGIVAEVPHLTGLAHAVAMESCDVAAAAGIDIDRDAVKRTISMSMHDHATHKPSMVRDVDAKRLTEIDALNGAVIALGRDYDVPTPRNETMLALIKAREAQYTTQGSGSSHDG